MIVALEVPLAITVRERALAELEAQSLVQAQTIAASIGAEGIDAPELEHVVQEAAAQAGGRVIVVDTDGVLVADSAGTGLIGSDYATPSRPELLDALQRRPVTQVRHSVDLGQDILVTAVPILDEAQLFGAVRISQSMAEVGAATRQRIVGLAVIGLGGLLAGLLIAFALSASFGRPLTRLAAAARRLGEGDLSVRAGNVRGAREIEQLAVSFDDMAERMEDAMRAQREFVANASHQLRTPLTGMKLRLEGAAAAAPSDEVRKQLEAAEHEVDRLSKIVDGLLSDAEGMEKPEERRTAFADVGAAVRQAVSRWEAKASQSNTTLEARGLGAVAAADPDDIDQILDNLIDNAILYAPGRVTVTSGQIRGWVFLVVEDVGPGIAPEDRDLVVERFHRGRGAAGEGSGLGLAIVRELAERWGGQVSLKSKLGTGTRVEVTLPPVMRSTQGARTRGPEG